MGPSDTLSCKQTNKKPNIVKEHPGGLEMLAHLEGEVNTESSDEVKPGKDKKGP